MAGGFDLKKTNVLAISDCSPDTLVYIKQPFRKGFRGEIIQSLFEPSNALTKGFYSTKRKFTILSRGYENSPYFPYLCLDEVLHCIFHLDPLDVDFISGKEQLVKLLQKADGQFVSFFYDTENNQKKLYQLLYFRYKNSSRSGIFNLSNILKKEDKIPPDELNVLFERYGWKVITQNFKSKERESKVLDIDLHIYTLRIKEEEFKQILLCLNFLKNINYNISLNEIWMTLKNTLPNGQSRIFGGYYTEFGILTKNGNTILYLKDSPKSEHGDFILSSNSQEGLGRFVSSIKPIIKSAGVIPM